MASVCTHKVIVLGFSCCQWAIGKWRVPWGEGLQKSRVSFFLVFWAPLPFRRISYWERDCYYPPVFILSHCNNRMFKDTHHPKESLHSVDSVLANGIMPVAVVGMFSKRQLAYAPVFFIIFPFFPQFGRNAGMIAELGDSILDSKVTMGMEAMQGRTARWSLYFQGLFR